MRLVIVVIVAMFSQCGKHRDDAAHAGPPAGPEPDVAACATDADCTFGFGIDESGCCLDANSKTAGAHTVAFDKWVAHRVASSDCANAICPALPSPMPPPAGACFDSPRCRSGKCGNACP